MNQKLERLCLKSVGYVKNNSSFILTCAGAAGLVATTIMTAKATVKAVEIINEKECKKGESLTKKEVFKATFTTYIPPVIMGVSTIACIFSANAFNKNKQAAMIGAYGLLDNSFKEYKGKLKELYGEDAHQKIMDALAVEKAEERYISSCGFIDSYSLMVDDNGDKRLFYEPISNRYFESTMEQVVNAEYHLNRNFVLRGYAPLNEFYDFLGLEQTEEGRELGWATEDEYYWVDFDHRKITLDDGLECIGINFGFYPDLNWQEYCYY